MFFQQKKEGFALGRLFCHHSAQMAKSLSIFFLQTSIDFFKSLCEVKIIDGNLGLESFEVVLGEGMHVFEVTATVDIT
jgi:hypothetical protein